MKRNNKESTTRNVAMRSYELGLIHEVIHLTDNLVDRLNDVQMRVDDDTWKCFSQAFEEAKAMKASLNEQEIEMNRKSLCAQTENLEAICGAMRREK